MSGNRNDASKIHAAYANQMGSELESERVPVITNDQLQAAFLAARGLGKVLNDEVLSAIIIAARNA